MKKQNWKYLGYGLLALGVYVYLTKKKPAPIGYTVLEKPDASGFGKVLSIPTEFAEAKRAEMLAQNSFTPAELQMRAEYNPLV
ncbi:MAG: hypothetical protein AB7K68_17615 [Bacteriovoracia bacterium]